MMNIRFAGMMRKYNRPYVLVRKAKGRHDERGDWQPGEPDQVTLQGHIQPVSIKMQQAEGGRYDEEDRTLYTTYSHHTGDLIEYMGKQYTVDTSEPRDYCDINNFMLKKVIVNDPV